MSLEEYPNLDFCFDDHILGDNFNQTVIYVFTFLGLPVPEVFAGSASIISVLYKILKHPLLVVVSTPPFVLLYPLNLFICKFKVSSLHFLFDGFIFNILNIICLYLLTDAFYVSIDKRLFEYFF